MKKITGILLSSTLVLGSLTGCGSSDATADTSSGTREILFWSAPNVGQYNFWQEKAAEFNETRTDVKVVVNQMPESPSSEAGIQSAIATGQPPIASENVSRGFATVLAESDAIYALNEYEQFSNIIENRNMGDIVEPWSIDGSQYVLPIYSVPMLMAWNLDALDELGVEVPTTFDEMYALGEKCDGVNQFATYGSKYAVPADWWEQWFYTLTYYHAVSNGQSFYEDGALVADDESMIEVLTYINTLADIKGGMLLENATDPFENGVALSTFVGGWQIPFWASSYPELTYGENYKLTPPLSVDGGSKYTFTDSKGISFYKGVPEEDTEAMFDFMEFVYSDPNTDNRWLEVTGLTPAREDLTTNESFKTYFDENPAMADFANYIPYGIPAMASADMVEIQTKMGERIYKMITSDVSPEETWENIKTDIGAL